MRFVCVSDTHNQLSQVELPPGDVLLHAGDLTGRGTLPEIQQALEELVALDYEHKIFIAGNHDFGFEQEPEKVKALLTQIAPELIYLRDSAVELEGIKIYGSPWQPWFHSWAFNLQRGAEIRQKWDLIPTDTDILITHGPPHGILDQTLMGDHAGCEELLKVIRERVRPKYHIFGHIHEGYGQEHDSEHDISYINASTCTLRYEPSNPAIVFDLSNQDLSR